MAIDSKEKRQSIPSVGRVWMRNTFSVATPDQQWRMDVSGAYGGNALSPPVGGSFKSAWAVDSSILIGAGFSV